MKTELLTDQLNDLLPQTQCRQCQYDGCKPYAEAMAAGKAPTNLCVPGGKPTLQALSQLLGVAEPEQISDKPPYVQYVTIREAECIGCTKCIQACPQDAIVGAAKMMHSVIEAYCTGCELCLPVCPVSCIDVHSDHEQPAWVINNPIQKSIANYAKQRYEQRLQRQATLSEIKRQKDLAKQTQKIKLEISACLNRVKAKKNDSIPNTTDF